MASKSQRKPAKRTANKPGRSAVSPRKASKSAKPAKKSAPKKAAPKKSVAKKPVKKSAPAKKAPPRKSAPKKAPPKKVAPGKKAAPKKAPPKQPAKPAGKAAPPKKTAPVKPVKPGKPAPAKPTPAKPAPAKSAPKSVAAPAPAPAKEPKPPRAAKPPKERPPKAELPTEAADATPKSPSPAPAGIAALAAAAGLPAGPRKRGRKRRDPLDDLLRPEKKRGRPGRPRKRAGLGELGPKRARLRKRIRGRRSTDDEMDLPVTPRPPAPRDTMSADEIRADVIGKYLRGETPTCPVGCGGLAQVVRVSTAENGAGEVWFECLSCAQRERFTVPAPTTQERDAIFTALEAGNEPLCPRHDGRWVQLRRRGRDLVCPDCGILIQGR